MYVARVRVKHLGGCPGGAYLQADRWPGETKKNHGKCQSDAPRAAACSLHTAGGKPELRGHPLLTRTGRGERAVATSHTAQAVVLANWAHPDPQKELASGMMMMMRGAIFRLGLVRERQRREKLAVADRATRGQSSLHHVNERTRDSTKRRADSIFRSFPKDTSTNFHRPENLKSHIKHVENIFEATSVVRTTYDRRYKKLTAIRVTG